MTSSALGNQFNVIAAASGVHIPLTRASAVTFITFEDDGSTIWTLKESQSGSGEQALAALSTLYKGPGVGGTWTTVSQTAAATYDLADDTANDCVVATVRADQLTNGFNSVELTVDGGIVVAIVHDLAEKIDPAQLRSSIVA